MPVQIKRAIIALVLSCIASLTAVVFDLFQTGSLVISSPANLFFGLIWIFIIAWLIFDVVKRKRDIRLTLVIVSVIMFLSSALDFFDETFRMSYVFEVVELVLWIVALYYLDTKPAKDWYHGVRS